jgi:hypothetical protein
VCVEIIFFRLQKIGKFAPKKTLLHISLLEHGISCNMVEWFKDPPPGWLAGWLAVCMYV